MKRRYIPGQKVYRIPPVPKYDFSGMENWLSDLAQEGLFLRKDGLFAGIASFECREPQTVQYRLEAAQQKGGIFSEDGGEPSDEQLELGEKYHWDYIARWGEFHIYRSSDSTDRELNTDAEVQAIALNAVKKRQRGWLFDSVYFLILYPLLRMRGCLLSMAVGAGVGWMLTWLCLTILCTADAIQAFVHLKRVQKALRNEGKYPDSSDWRKRAVPYFARRILKILLIALLIAVLLRTLGVELTHEEDIPIEAYGDTLPFATLRDISGGHNYERISMGHEMGINSVEEKQNRFSHSISYNEHASYTLSDGRMGSGGLYVDYVALKDERLARRMVRELYRIDKRKKNVEPLSAPALQADETIVYRNELHFPTVIFRKGSTVVRAYFYQTTGDRVISMETWMGMICDSVEG